MRDSRAFAANDARGRWGYRHLVCRMRICPLDFRRRLADMRGRVRRVEAVARLAPSPILPSQPCELQDPSNDCLAPPWVSLST
jgi:hypothetical protein